MPIREIREKKKEGTPNPGPSQPGLGFSLAGQALAAGPLLPPSGRHPWCLGEGVRCTPSPLYKGGSQEERTQHQSMRPPPRPPSTSSLVRRPPLVRCPLRLSPSLPCGLPKGCVGDGNHHRDTLSYCGVSGSMFQSLYFYCPNVLYYYASCFDVSRPECMSVPCSAAPMCCLSTGCSNTCYDTYTNKYYVKINNITISRSI
jgi:hypothetical protein